MRKTGISEAHGSRYVDPRLEEFIGVHTLKLMSDDRIDIQVAPAMSLHMLILTLLLSMPTGQSTSAPPTISFVI